MKHSIEALEEKAYQYRKRFLEIFTGLGYGHLTTAFSWTEIAVALQKSRKKISNNLQKRKGV